MAGVRILVEQRKDNPHLRTYYTNILISRSINGPLTFHKPGFGILTPVQRYQLGVTGSDLLSFLFTYQCFDKLVLGARSLEVTKGGLYNADNVDLVVLDVLQTVIGLADNISYSRT